MKDYIKEITQVCYNQLPKGIENFFLHCTFEEDVVGPSLYYKKNGIFPKLIMIEFPSDSVDLLMDFWNEGFPNGKKEKWEIACFIYIQGKIKIDLTYPDQITEEDRSDYNYRSKFIKKYYGNIKEIYPKP